MYLGKKKKKKVKKVKIKKKDHRIQALRRQEMVFPSGVRVLESTPSFSNVLVLSGNKRGRSQMNFQEIKLHTHQHPLSSSDRSIAK